MIKLARQLPGSGKFPRNPVKRLYMVRKRSKADAEFGDYYTEEPRQPQTSAPVTPTVRQRWWWVRHVAGWMLVVLAGLAVVRLVAGQPLFEKSLKALIAPVGLVWMLLFLIAWLSLVRRQPGLAVLALLAWLVLTLGGNALFVSWLANSLQEPYVEFDVDQAEPVQILLVLGGGTGTTPAGKAQGGGAADRVIVAARMALSGRAEHVVCAGTSGVGAVPGRLPAADQMRQLLLALQVPDVRLSRIGGRNTWQEMERFATWLNEDEQRQQKSIGIVTTAWHMNRALRLANSFDVQARPIPADFCTIRPRHTPHLLIPGAGHLQSCQAFVFEYLAGWLGR